MLPIYSIWHIDNRSWGTRAKHRGGKAMILTSIVLSYAAFIGITALCVLYDTYFYRIESMIALILLPVNLVLFLFINNSDQKNKVQSLSPSVSEGSVSGTQSLSGIIIETSKRQSQTSTHNECKPEKLEDLIIDDALSDDATTISYDSDHEFRYPEHIPRTYPEHIPRTYPEHIPRTVHISPSPSPSSTITGYTFEDVST